MPWSCVASCVFVPSCLVLPFLSVLRDRPHAGGFGRASALAMSQLAWWTSRAIFSIFT